MALTFTMHTDTHRTAIAGRQRKAGLIAGLLLFGVQAAYSADVTGQRVGQVLDNLRAQGLTFIYNTDVIPPELRVVNQPSARTGLELAREILAIHKLTVAEVVPGVYAVVAELRQAPQPGALRPADGSPLHDSTGSTLEEIVVNTSRYTFSGNGSSQAFLTQDQLQSMPRLADEPLRAVQRLPGAANNGFSSLGPIRGGDPNETAIVLDGLRLLEPFHLKNFLNPVSLLDSRVIESVEVYSGGYPAIFGSRMSAVIDVTTVRPSRPRYYEAGLSLFHASGLVSTQFAQGRGRGLVSARRSNAGILANTSESDFGTPNYSDGFARLDYEFSRDTRGTVETLLSNDRISALRDSGMQRAQAEYRNAYTWATLEHDWSPRASSRLIASLIDVTNQRSGQVNNLDRHMGSLNDQREFHIMGLGIDNRLDIGILDQRFGAEVRYLTGEYDYSSAVRFEPGFPFPGSPALETRRDSSPRPEGFEASVYWDGRAKFGAQWTVEAGSRFDVQTYVSPGDSVQWSPRLGVLYDLNDRTRLRASWGRYSQAQGINELQVEDGVSQFNPAQHADHVILSFDHNFVAGVDLRVEAYRKYYRRVSPRFENQFDALVLLPELEPDRVRIAPQSALSEGVELLLKLRPQGPWSAWFSYTWSRVEDRIDGRDFRRSWDQRDAVSAGLTWSSGPWSATATYTYHTGWPTTELGISSDPRSQQEVVVGKRNGVRFDEFNSLDFRITRTFALARGTLDVFVEGSNALMQTNPCCVEYMVTRRSDSTLDISKDVDNWLPLVPSAGVLWRF